MCGLQGSGKTTTCGKLGRMLKAARPAVRCSSRPTCSVRRPSTNCTCSASSWRSRSTPNARTKIRSPSASAAVREAKKLNADVVILDTAGRLHIDDELMGQLERIDRQIGPQQVYLVVDGMTGQDAVNSAKAFNDALELDGVIMTKLDGDARGGAALSVKQVTGVPIKFIGTGEHLDALEEFHPDRMAGRILGQGDVLSLVEKAQQEFDQDEMLRQEERLSKGEFTLDDFRKQLSQIGKLGPLQKVMGTHPRHGRDDRDDGRCRSRERHEAAVRHHRFDDAGRAAQPSKTIDQSRRRRIAAGAGVEPHEVNDLVKQFDAMAQMMTSLAGKGMRERMKMVRELQIGNDAKPERAGKVEGRHRQTPDTQREGKAQERARKGNAQATRDQRGGAGENGEA